MELERKILKNIYFDSGESGGAGGDVTPPPTVETPTEIEVPSYINEYINGMEEGDQKGYISEMIKDQRGVNTLKGFIKDPNAEWNIDTKEYKEKVEGVDEFIQEMKSNGYSQEATQKLIQNRIDMLEREKAQMTPEELAAGDNIINFITQEKSDARKAVYQRMSEYAEGRRVLLEFMKLKGGNPTPGANTVGATGGFTEESFIATYNEALDNKDTNKMKELKSFAENVRDKNSFFAEFLGI